MKRVSTFAGRVLVVLAVLAVLSWPKLGFARAYAEFFRVQAAALYGSSDGAHTLEIGPDDDPTTPGDTRMVLRAPTAGARWNMACRSFLGFLPLCFFVALYLAIQPPRGRRWRTLWLGVLVVDAHAAAGVGLLLAKGWAHHVDRCPLVHAEIWTHPPLRALLDGTVAVLVQAPSVNLLVPLLAFAIVGFRREIAACASGRREPDKRSSRPTAS